MNKKATILVVSGNLASKNARNCLKSLKMNTPPELVREIIIIEAGIRPDFNHAEEINRVMQIFKGEYLVLLDDDVILETGWLNGLIGCAEKYQDAGIIGAILKDRKNRIIHSGGEVTDNHFGIELREPIYKPTERKYACSAVMLIKRETIEKIGQFDEGYRKYGQETDYCLKAWENGFKVLVSPEAKAIHLVGQTAKLRPDVKDLWEKDRIRFYTKWRESSVYNKYEVFDLCRRGNATPFSISKDSAGNEKIANQRLIPLEEVKKQIDGWRNQYKLQYIDIIDDELTEKDYLCELVSYCKSMNLYPAIITGGQNAEIIADLIEAGLEDLLIKIPIYKETSGSKSVIKRAGRTIEVFKTKEFGFRTTTTVLSPGYDHLEDLAEELIDMGPRIADFVFFNPHGSNGWSKESGLELPKYSDVAPYLKGAIDRLMASGIWVNIRYFPLCLLNGYEQHICNFHQAHWDPYHWDYFQVYGFDKRGITKLRRRISRKKLFGVHREDRMKLWLTKKQICAKNQFSKQCSHCANLEICDGIYPQYVAKFGLNEFKPREGESIRDPLYYRRKNQAWRILKPRPIIPPDLL